MLYDTQELSRHQAAGLKHMINYLPRTYCLLMAPLFMSALKATQYSEDGISEACLNFGSVASTTAG